MMRQFETLVDVVPGQEFQSGHVEYIDGPHERRRISFTELYRAALGVLWNFQQRGLTPGDHLILFTPDNQQFIDGFWACVLGGIVPVPVAVGISDAHRHKLIQIVARLGRPFLYTTGPQVARLEKFAESEGLSVASTVINERTFTAEQVADISQPGQVHRSASEDTALIQFSSGSTSEPKGIVLSHANLLANIRAIIERSRLTPQDRGLSWMPLTHDMGLIGQHLAQSAAGISQAIMPTSLFSRRPLLWLKEASNLCATLLSSPNFGYKHFLKVFEGKGLEGVDLSAVRIIWNGAEPISSALCTRFLDAMEPFGLSRATMQPVYGLAEGSVAVTMPKPDRKYGVLSVKRLSLAVGRQAQMAVPGSADAVDIVGVGQPINNCRLRIADANDSAVPDGSVGRIQICGGNVTDGYHDPGGRLEQPYTLDGWLKTGDLGFMDNGELYVTGREKEIIFINGENYYPHDLELIAEHHAGVELGKVVVAGARVTGQDEDEVIVFLLHRGSLEDFLPLANQVKRSIAERAAVDVGRIVPLRTIPKTTSGKLQRRQLAHRYEAGEFAAILASLDLLAQASVTNCNERISELEHDIFKICAAVIVDRDVGADDDFFELGITSLALAQIYERIDEKYPGCLDMEDLFERSSIRAIASHLEASREKKSAGQQAS